jgi:hypothetical protein
MEGEILEVDEESAQTVKLRPIRGVAEIRPWRGAAVRSAVSRRYTSRVVGRRERRRHRSVRSDALNDECAIGRSRADVATFVD